MNLPSVNMYVSVCMFLRVYTNPCGVIILYFFVHACFYGSMYVRRYKDFMVQKILSWDSTQQVALALFIVVTIALYYGYYMPLIKSLNEENRRTAALLLMLPSDVLISLPDILGHFDRMLITSAGTTDVGAVTATN